MGAGAVAAASVGKRYDAVLFYCPAGQEEFDAITRTYYRGAGAAVIAFSTTDRASFDAVSMWKGKIEAECGDIAVALVQNKCDLADQAVVSATEVEGIARKLGLKLYRTCVKEGINVIEVSSSPCGRTVHASCL